MIDDGWVTRRTEEPGDESRSPRIMEQRQDKCPNDGEHEGYPG